MSEVISINDDVEDKKKQHYLYRMNKYCDYAKVHLPEIYYPYFCNDTHMNSERRIDYDFLVSLCNNHRHRSLCTSHIVRTPCCNLNFFACLDTKCSGIDCQRRYRWNHGEFFDYKKSEIGYIYRSVPGGYLEITNYDELYPTT